MTTVTLTDPDKATEAGQWCNKNLGRKDWDMALKNIFTKRPLYEFSFADPKKATLFALKWV